MTIIRNRDEFYSDETQQDLEIMDDEYPDWDHRWSSFTREYSSACPGLYSGIYGSSREEITGRLRKIDGNLKELSTEFPDLKFLWSPEFPWSPYSEGRYLVVYPGEDVPRLADRDHHVLADQIVRQSANDGDT